MLTQREIDTLRSLNATQRRWLREYCEEGLKGWLGRMPENRKRLFAIRDALEEML